MPNQNSISKYSPNFEKSPKEWGKVIEDITPEVDHLLDRVPVAILYWILQTANCAILRRKTNK